MVAQANHTAELKPSDVHIRQYQARDQAQVEQLFTAGMVFYARMYADTIPDAHERMEQYVQQCIADDLRQIEQVYLLAGGNFWVATVRDSADSSSNRSVVADAADGDKVVAMVGLQAKGNGVGELRRMAVNPAYHRFGLGRKLVAHLESWAKANAFEHVQLSTGSIMTSARKFYPSIGYEHTKTVADTDNPKIGALFFAKTL